MKAGTLKGNARSVGGIRLKNPKQTIKRLLKMIFGRNTPKLIIAFICIIISSFASVYSASFINTLIDEGIGVQLENVKNGVAVTYAPIIRMILKMAVIFVAGILSSLIYVMLMAVISQTVLKTVRNDMFIKMQRLPVKYFDTHPFGDTMSRFTNDTDALEQLISQSIPNVLTSIITIVVSLIQMFLISWELTIVVLLTVVLLLVAIKNVGGKSAGYFVRQQTSIGRVNGFIEEMINGQKVIKVFCHEESAKEGFDKVNDELCENATLANKYVNIFMPIMGNLTYFQYALVAIIGGIMAINGWLHVETTSSLGLIGVVSAFLMLSRAFARPINMVSQQFNAIVTALAGSERIFQLMDEEPETDDGYVSLVKVEKTTDGELHENADGSVWAWKHPHGDGSVTYTELKGKVNLVDVDFSYDGEKKVLKDVTIDVKPGQKVALVGRTGAGKTTITNLINRFYDISDGKICYDDININKIKKPDLRKSLGVVLQEVNLFTGTVMENIRYGKLDATDEEVYAAARLACADSFIKLLPDGYDTMLTLDGANLSQGQRQLISIARVAIADPPVMILDEATSSIDTRTEAIVQNGMDNLMKGRTVFVIAHRLSTIRNADNIIVLDNGSILEQGNHDELIAKKGAYYGLYTGSFAQNC